VAHGAPDDLLADRVALGVVALQQRGSGAPLHDERELPREVQRVLDPGVHALATGGRVDVGGVAGDEHPSDAVPIGQAVADAEHR
jgi:hypothetical protein